MLLVFFIFRELGPVLPVPPPVGGGAEESPACPQLGPRSRDCGLAKGSNTRSSLDVSQFDHSVMVITSPDG